MSIFGELDFASVQDNPWSVEDGTYEAILAEFKVGPTKAGDKVGVMISYKLNDSGSSVSEWKEIPSQEALATAEGKRAASFLKQRLASLGVPESHMNSVTAQELVGTRVLVTVKNNTARDGSGRVYTNVTNVALDEAGDRPLPAYEYPSF